METKESYLKIENDYLFYRRGEILPGRKTLLFVHGLGESGLCFREVFEDNRFSAFNLIVPDLIGYGRSSKSAGGNYSFRFQISRLSKLVNRLEIEELILVGHSMGGDITTLFCREGPENIIKGYVNVEGDITQFDVFISNHAVAAYKENRFYEWFYNDFMNNRIYRTLGNRYPSARRYYASLSFCRFEAFLSNAREVIKRNTLLEGRFKSEIGEIYSKLTLPRVYCYGTESVPEETLSFLETKGLRSKAFKGAGHWLMIDKAAEFYDFLHSFVSP
ncbi:alpha/beta fold hydrolase [Thermodesulfobacteriota bacterium]